MWLGSRVPVAQTIILDRSQRVVPFEYAIQTRLPGRRLTQVWQDLDDRGRNRILDQLVDILQALGEVKFERFGALIEGLAAPDWASDREYDLQRLLAEAKKHRGLDRELLMDIWAYFQSHRHALEGAEAVLVHGDFHFDNLLAEGDRITGVVDWEFARAAPPDMELDQLLRFLRMPKRFVAEELEGTVSPTDFADVLPGLMARMPELFATPQLGTRLTIYALIYDLNMLIQACGRWPAAVGQIEGWLRDVLNSVGKNAWQAVLLPSAFGS